MSSFKIFIDRLKNGETLKIKESLNPSFLGVDEPDLRFPSNVSVQGDAYLTDSDLILHLKAQADFLMPCAICNEMVKQELKVDNFYHAVPVEEIPGAVFDYTEALREALLIDVPKYMECNKGKCSERAELAPYMKKAAPIEEKKSHFPFADLVSNLESSGSYLRPDSPEKVREERDSNLHQVVEREHDLSRDEDGSNTTTNFRD